MILMSAVAKDYAYVVTKKQDAKPEPIMTKEQLAAIKADVKKYRQKK